jgi:hypothetical protein
LGGPLSKLCVTPPFSNNFRCQIKNQVSDYRLLGASSLFDLYKEVCYFEWIFFPYVNTNVLHMDCISGNINKEHEYVQSLFVVSLNLFGCKEVTIVYSDFNNQALNLTY